MVEDWTPGRGTAVLWSVLSLPMTLLGMALFAVPYAALRGTVVFSPSVWGVLSAFVIFAGLMPVHEWVHGQTMRLFGASPTYGATVIGGIIPAFYCTAEGYRFSRPQFVTVALAPFCLISSLGTLWVTLGPGGGWLGAPLSFHFAGCIGDFWVTALALRQPPGTLFEDTKTGLRLHRRTRPATG